MDTDMEYAPTELPTSRSKVAISQYGNKRFIEGVNNGISLGKERGRKEALEELHNELKRSKLDQIKAVTELIKVQTENMSKTGYLISQLNKEKGW